MNFNQKQLEEFFKMLDLNEDGHLNQKEIKKYLDLYKTKFSFMANLKGMKNKGMSALKDILGFKYILNSHDYF